MQQEGEFQEGDLLEVKVVMDGAEVWLPGRIMGLLEGDQAEIYVFKTGVWAQRRGVSDCSWVYGIW